ncbi:hypothetical protein DIPPA_51440, partial [Diplonema papillatum]
MFFKRFRHGSVGGSTTAVLRKNCLLGLNASAMLGSIVSIFGPVPAVRYLSVCGLVISVSALACILMTCRVSQVMVSWNLGCYALIVLLFDWIQAAYLGVRMWPSIVLILNVNLATDGSTWLPFGIMGISLLWFVMSLIEESFRVGIYDSAGVFGWAGIAACDCDNPPCFAGGVPDALPGFASPVLVLGTDFYFKRRFSKSMFAANESLEASIAVTQSTARALADFDLETASSHLDSSTDLPDALREAFVQLLTNLTSYKPYLPEAILNSHSSCQDTPVRE